MHIPASRTRQLSLPPLGTNNMQTRASTPVQSVRASLSSNLLGTISGSDSIGEPRRSSLPPLGPPRSRAVATEKRAKNASLLTPGAGEANSLSAVQGQAQDTHHAEKVMNEDAPQDTHHTEKVMNEDTPTQPGRGSSSVLGMLRAAARDGIAKAMPEPSFFAPQSSPHPRPLEISSALHVSGTSREGLPNNESLTLPHRARQAGASVSAAKTVKRAPDFQRPGGPPNTMGERKSSRSTVSGTAGVEIVLVEAGRTAKPAGASGGAGKPPRHSSTPADALATINMLRMLEGTTRKDARGQGDALDRRSGAVAEETATRIGARDCSGVSESGPASVTAGASMTQVPSELVRAPAAGGEAMNAQEQGGSGHSTWRSGPISPAARSVAVMSQRLAVCIDIHINVCMYISTYIYGGVYRYIHIYIYIYICTYTCMYVHVCILASCSSCMHQHLWSILTHVLSPWLSFTLAFSFSPAPS